MKKVIRMMISRFGWQRQSIVAIEEMSELQKELTKFLRGKGNHAHLVEEFVDVNIMLAQIKEMYNIQDDEYSEMLVEKLYKMESYLDEEELLAE